MKNIISYLRLGSLIRTCLRDCPEIVPRLSRLDSLSLVSRQSDLATLQQSDRATFGNKISRRVALLFAVLVMSMANIGMVWGENQQHTQGVACSNPNNYPNMKINVKRYNGDGCSSWKDWEDYSMTKAGITFEGKQLFVGEYWTCNGLYNLQYQMYDGSTWKEQYEQYAGSAVYDYYNNFVYDYDTHAYYSTLTFQKGHIYFDATGWNETDIKLTIGHANFQRYYGMTTVTGTKLYYYHLDLNDAFADAMGFGVVGNTSASDGTNWLTNVSDKASEYTGYRHYGMNNSGGDIRYLIVNKGKAGEQPDVDYDDDYTSLNSTQTFYSVVKETGGNYTTANSKATISISSYELTSQGGTTNRTPSISTSANNTTVSACRTANTRLQIGTVATGYQFDGWWTDATSGSKVTESTDYTYNPTGENTLYARFSAKVYSITYKDQGNKDFTGTQDGAPTSHTYGAATALKIPTKSGYTFGGWFTASDCASGAVGTAAAASLGATDYTANITLYAQWTANEYSVEEHTNGGRIWADSVGSYTYGAGATLPTNITKWGYDFEGWYDNAELTGEPVTAIGTSETGAKHYYAKWTAISQNYPTVSHPEFLAAQEGDIIVVNVTGVHTSAAIYLQNWSYAGIANLSIASSGKYAFQLSAAAASNLRTDGLRVTGNNFSFSGVQILYRNTIWSGTLSDNSGWKEEAVDKSIFSGLSGGDFLGLNISAINDGNSWHQYAMRADYDAVLSSMPTETGIGIHKLSAADVVALRDSVRIDITAQYLDISNLYSYTSTRNYAVTLNTNDGTINAGEVTSYTFGTGATLPTDVSRIGYTFAGWYPDEEFEGSCVYTIPTTDYGDKTYYAKWTADAYTITYKDQGDVAYSGSNEGSLPNSHTYGVTTALVNGVRTGYTFGGWFDNSSCTGDAITSIGATAKTADFALYAKWTANVYRIDYDMAGGEWKSGWVGERTYDAGDQAISSDVTKNDYNFAGWYDNSEYEGDAVTAVSSTLAADITLYAKWTALSKTTLTPALNPIICTALEGDVVVVTVSATQSAGAYIQLEDKDGVTFGNSLPVSGTGTYAIPLTAAEATKVNAGLNVSGSNYTISAVIIKYQKPLWNDGIDGTSGWAADELPRSIFDDLSAGDFLGVMVTKVNGDYYSYRIQIGYKDLYEQSVSGTGTFIHQLTSDEISSLRTTDEIITIASGNSALSALYTYVATKNYTITLNANGGTGGSVSVEATYNSATLPAFTNPTKSGNVFAGWYSGSGGTGNLVINNIGELQADVSGYTGADGIWIAAENKTLYAKWMPLDDVAEDCWDDGEYKCGDIENFDTPEPTGSTVNWSTATWGNGSAPTAETDVALTENMIVDVTDAKAKSIVLDDEITLTVSANKSLVVTGTITRENGSPTTASDLIIRSTEDGNGTLIFENDGNAATIEMYSIASTTGTNWTWQYIGVPLATAKAEQTYYGGYLYKWASNQWNTVHKDDDLTPFAGYCVSYPATNHKYVLEGALATETSKDITVPAGKEMVVGNSWTAPIQIKQMTTDDFVNLEATVYLFNTGSDEDGSGSTSGTRYESGTYRVIPINASAATGDSVISALQGFYVESSESEEGDDGTLKLSYSKHVRPAAGNSVVNGAMHAPRHVDAEAQPNVLKLWACGSRYDDQLILLEREDFSTGFDNGWDGKKLDELGAQPMLYTQREDGTPDAVSAIPTIDGTSLMFRAGEDNQYTIRMEYSAENEPLYLYDLQEHKYTRIETDATYTFDTYDKQAHTRFLLTRTRAPQVPTDNREWMNPDKEKAVKFIDNNRIYIFRNGVIYDATGKRVKRK